MTAEDLDLELYQQLRTAVRSNDVQGVRNAIAAGANPRWRGNIALQIATRAAAHDVVRVLLEAGADVTARDHWAMCWARTNDDARMFDVLLTTGAYDGGLPDNLGERGPLAHPNNTIAIAYWERRVLKKNSKEKSKEEPEGLGL